MNNLPDHIIEYIYTKVHRINIIDVLSKINDIIGNALLLQDPIQHLINYHNAKIHSYDNVYLWDPSLSIFFDSFIVVLPDSNRVMYWMMNAKGEDYMFDGIYDENVLTIERYYSTNPETSFQTLVEFMNFETIQSFKEIKTLESLKNMQTFGKTEFNRIKNSWYKRKLCMFDTFDNEPSQFDESQYFDDMIDF